MIPLLELATVTAGYHRPAKIIDDLSLSLFKGDFTGIIGPNGAGKTTLFRLITGTLAPWRGEVLFRGTGIRELPKRELARSIATVPQMFDTVFPFTVEEFVLMGRYPHTGRFSAPTEKDLAIAEDCMRRTDTIALRRRTVDELSGGEKQRAVLAQALTQSPELLLLDEPTAHLDIGHQTEMLDLIKKLNRDSGLTVVMVIHDLNMASEYCSRVVLLDRGRVHSHGHPADVLTYQAIEEVYRTVVIVRDNPITGRPHVFPVSRENLKNL